MVEVNLWSGLRRLADDQLVISVEARNLKEMLDGLLAAYPALAPVIKAGVSISVNGVIETNLFAPLPPDPEIYLIQRIKGG